MKYTETYEENHVNLVLVYMVVIMIAVIVGVTAIIFIMNKPASSSKGYQLALAQSSQYAQDKIMTDEMVKSVDDLVSGSTLTSDQLDIWTLPDTGKTDEASVDTKNGTVKNQTTGETLVQGIAKPEDKDQTAIDKMTDLSDLETTEEASTEEMAAQEMTLLLADGTEKTITISDTLAKNTYDTTQFKYQKPEMKYYEDKKQVSTFGTAVSSQDGTVDFSKLKRTGCDFVMIRVGQRGSSSGKIVMDSNYKDNFTKAKKAGLDIGVYFYSQALTKEEALEEADSLLSAVEDTTITYPVMFDMETISDDSARTDALDVKKRTELAKTFMDEIADAGYDPILYGNLEWLMVNLDLEQLKEYDICVAENSETPEFPYEYKMWQYNDEATINGIDEKARLFVWMNQTNLNK